ncbi:hypothetical protein L6R50_20370 [Myxococcota bacterium]|nr:hypothetical protein [Myxococcota bacterium]
MSGMSWTAAAVALCLLPAAPALALPTLEVEANSTAVAADGLSTTKLRVWPRLDDGTPVPDGTVITLSSDLGKVVGSGVVTGGAAPLTFKAGTYPGLATLYKDGWEVTGDTAIDLLPGEPVGTSLHLHGSFSEGDATMRGHTIEADEQGVDVMWWTDHDYLYYPGHDLESTGWDFETGSLTANWPTWPAGNSTDIGWGLVSSSFNTHVSEVGTAYAHTGNFGWRLSATSGNGDTWRSLFYTFDSWPLPINMKPLMGQVDFRVQIRPETVASADAELWFVFNLSRGTDGVVRRIHLYHSNTSYSYLNSATARYVRITAPRGVWTEVSADLTAIARAHFSDFGDDSTVNLASIQIKARNRKTVTYDLDDFEWTQEIVGEELRDVQRDYLDSLPYSPEHLVGVEMGMLPDRHINAFGSSVPMFPFSDHPEWDIGDVVSMVHDYGGIASFNHMFGVVHTVLTDLERAEQVVSAIDFLLTEEVFGCDLLEVGYREREGVLGDFLEVWDALSTSGLVVTGIGANDGHDQHDWDTWTNNFVTWVGSATSTEDDLIWNLRRGNTWFGDPTLFAGGEVEASLISETAQATMGQVVIGATDAQDIVFRANPLKAGWTVKLVESGVETSSWTVPIDGYYSASQVVDPTGGNVVRFEVYTDTGAPALFTNPIYYFDGDDDLVALAVADERVPSP